MPEVVIAGDLNLHAETGNVYDVRNCTGDMTSVNDGAVQHVFASPTIEVVDVDDEEVTSTDHPLLNLRFRLSPATLPARAVSGCSSLAVVAVGVRPAPLTPTVVLPLSARRPG